MSKILAIALCALLGSAAPVPDSQRFWISSTGKTHNSNCRYYNNCKGHFSPVGSGDNCKLCGGDGNG